MKGAQIKQIMQRLKMTQQELADELGVARNTVNRWANELEAVPRLAELALEAVELKRAAKDQKKVRSSLRVPVGVGHHR